MIKKTAKSLLSFVMILCFVFLTLFGLKNESYPAAYDGEFAEGIPCISPAPHESASPKGAQKGKELATGLLKIKNEANRDTEKTELICGGEIFGVRMETEGLLITELGEVETENGAVSPGEAAGLKKGDVLTEADGVKLEDAADLVKIVSRSEGGTVTLKRTRQGVTEAVTLRPALSADGSGYKAGLWVRDGAAGIGTVTFQDPESGAFAGLGHAVCDSASGTVFPLRSGTVCGAVTVGIRKGGRGSPGELQGKLDHRELGSVLANTPTGVYGTMPLPEKAERKTVPIASKEEVTKGKAILVCTLDQGGKKEYEIQIEEIIDKNRETKNLILCITDPSLLEQTGGIIQGMSGSPILQNGKLVGACTHVLVGDPTRGYGIFIENMLENMPE